MSVFSQCSTQKKKSVEIHTKRSLFNEKKTTMTFNRVEKSIECMEGDNNRNRNYQLRMYLQKKPPKTAFERFRSIDRWF